MNKNKINLLNFSILELLYFFSLIGEKKFRVFQFLRLVYKKNLLSFFDMGEFPYLLRYKLNDLCFLNFPIRIKSEYISYDNTIKWLFKLDDNNYIETVFINNNNMNSLCISTQVGCISNCCFCATSSGGFNRNLSVVEILSQFWYVKNRLNILFSSANITNVVFMGMGEPLFNFKNMSYIINIIQNDNVYGFSCKKIILSTSGIVPYIYKLADYNNVSLAVSLNAFDDKLRNQLMPINNKYNLYKLLLSCEYFINKINNFITFEYILFRNINDSIYDAYKLVLLLKNINCKVNLILFNYYYGAFFFPSFNSSLLNFINVLKKNKFVVILRKKRGFSINAACGQLFGYFYDKKKKRCITIKYF